MELFREGTPLRPRSVPSDAKANILQKRNEDTAGCLQLLGWKVANEFGDCWSVFFFLLLLLNWKWMQMREKLLLGERQKAQRS